MSKPGAVVVICPRCGADLRWATPGAMVKCGGCGGIVKPMEPKL